MKSGSERTLGHVDWLVKLPGRIIETRPMDRLCLFQLDLDLGAHQYVPALLGYNLHGIAGSQQ